MAHELEREGFQICGGIGVRSLRCSRVDDDYLDRLA